MLRCTFCNIISSGSVCSTLVPLDRSKVQPGKLPPLLLSDVTRCASVELACPLSSVNRATWGSLSHATNALFSIYVFDLRVCQLCACCPYRSFYYETTSFAMKALTLQLDLATRFPSLRLPGNIKNYTCCHRGTSRHCFLCSCHPNVNLRWNTSQSKTQFQMYWNICKQAPASVRCHPAWFKSVKLKSKYSHTMHFAGSGRYLHIFVCTSRSVCASRSGRYLHRGNHTQVPVCRKHCQFASEQTLDTVHIEIC